MEVLKEPNLKIEKQFVNIISYKDLDKFIEEKTKTYNYSYYEFQVVKSHFDSFSQKMFEEWEIDKCSSNIDVLTLLNGFCYKGYIEPGIYFIEVHW